jgi:DNA-damage-inducible protein J
MGKIKKSEAPARSRGNGGLTKADPIKTGMIRARIDPDLKDRAETILNAEGLNASEAIRLFYTQIVLEDGLPFPVRIPNAETIEAMRAAEAGELTRYGSVAEMFEKLGI